MAMIEFVADREIYEKVICGFLRRAERFVWLATSDLKDMYVDSNGEMVPLLGVLSSLVRKNVEIRLLHAKEPCKAFRRDFDRYPNLITGMERVLCPRVHLKAVIVDGRIAYSGSANITGAGMGAKSVDKRNFESGFITDESAVVDKIVEQFDSIWRGSRCGGCKRKEYCSDYKDLLGQK